MHGHINVRCVCVSLYVTIVRVISYTKKKKTPKIYLNWYIDSLSVLYQCGVALRNGLCCVENCKRPIRN